MSPSSPQVVYAWVEADTLPRPLARGEKADTSKRQKTNSGIYRSADQGKSWKRLGTAPLKGRTEWPGPAAREVARTLPGREETRNLRLRRLDIARSRRLALRRRRPSHPHGGDHA